MCRRSSSASIPERRPWRVIPCWPARRTGRDAALLTKRSLCWKRGPSRATRTSWSRACGKDHRGAGCSGKRSRRIAGIGAVKGSITRAALLGGLAGSETVAFLGVLPGQGERLGGDADLDGVLDGDDPSLATYDGALRITDEPDDQALPPGANAGRWRSWCAAGLPPFSGIAATFFSPEKRVPN